MAILYKSIYEIDLNNQNYIDAIIKFNKNVVITHVDDKDIETFPEAKVCGKDLLAMIAAAKAKGANSLKIQCGSGDGLATVGCFPSLNHLNNALAKCDFTNDDMTRAINAAQGIQYHIVFSAGADHGSACPKPLEDSEPGSYRSLTLSQAFLMLNELHKRIDLTGAIHLAALNTIVFQHNSVNYALKYGEITSLERLYVTLDLDDGFYHHHAAIDSEICEELNKLFTPWKQNNYQGDIIPQVSSGFNCDRFPQLSVEQLRVKASASQLQRRAFLAHPVMVSGPAELEVKKARCLIM